MSTHPIVPSVLGLAAEAAARRDVAALSHRLETLPDGAWSLVAPGGSTVSGLVAHLASGAHRLGEAWRRHADPSEARGPLQHPIHEPATEIEAPATNEAARAAYAHATGELLQALGSCREEDWAWPVWSPLGGTETLASAVRRWVAHHRVHHTDIATATDTPLDADPDLATLVTEFVLDAVARRGGPVASPPLHVEAVVGPPGAGTWTLVVDAPPSREDLPPLWQEIVSREEPLDAHRLERGSAGDARVVVRGTGESLWRAAFDRGASWSDLQVHGDDEARGTWSRMVAALTDADGIARVQT